MDCGIEFQQFALWEKRRLHYWNSRFPGNTAKAALPQEHLASLGDSNNVQNVVDEEPGIMGSVTGRKRPDCTQPPRAVWTAVGPPDKGLQASRGDSVKKL